MRHLSTPLSLALIPLILPASAEEGQPATPPPAAAENCGQRADETMGTATRVDAALQELGTEFAPATTASEAPMPEAPEGQSVAVSDGGLFFDAANSQLVYLHNVRLTDSRVRLRAANRLYIQLPKKAEEEQPQAAPAPAPQAPAPAEEQPGREAPAAADKPAPAPESTTPPAAPQPTPAPQAEAPAQEAPTAPTTPTEAAPKKPRSTTADLLDIPLEVSAYDALVDSVANRMVFTSGPGTPELSFRQGDNVISLTQEDGAPARALADEHGNILLEAPVIHVRWRAEDGTLSEFRATGGRALYHAATHAMVMDGPVAASYRDGESTLHCSGPLCATLRPKEGAATRKRTGFMSQFTSMRFNGIAAASATGNVQLTSRSGGENAEPMAISGDALYYNGLTGKVEVPGTPCIISYGEGGRNTLQTDGSLVLESNGDIHLNGKGNIEGTYERPAREKGGTPQRGTLSAQAPLSFHAATGTVTTRALNCRDAETTLSCTGEVLVTLTPRADAAALPPQDKTGKVNTAIARYDGISAVKAVGQVRGQMLDPATPGTPEATLTGTELEANLLTGEMRLTGLRETAAIAFRGYSLSGTANALSPASVHLKPNGDIEVRGEQVACTIPSDKGITTVNSTERMLLAREPRSISLGASTRIQSPDGIITTNGPMQAVLAPSTRPGGAKPLSPRFPQLTYDFSGLDSAETFSGATVRTPQGSMQCSQHLSILMLPEGSEESRKSSLGGIRSAIATGQVLIAAKDSNGRVLRAAGDRLEVDGITGEKKLTGSKVVLEDARNRHEASGAGAAVRIDARNNARITGARHSTYASGLRGQVEENDKKNQNTPNKPN